MRRHRRRKIPHLCGGKRIYPSRDQAENAGGRALAKKGNNSASALRIYSCPKCKGYHLTKQL